MARKWQTFYRRLIRLREDLLAARKDLLRTAAEPVASFSQHMADAASDDFDHDLALAGLSLEQDALYEVEAALRRIERGTYGVCEVSGKPIPLARLKAVPWARFTAEAGAQLEKRGALGRAKLGELGSVRSEEDERAELAETPEAQEAEENNSSASSAPEDQLWMVSAPAVAVPRGQFFKPAPKAKPG